jgi:fatty acid desaturase
MSTHTNAHSLAAALAELDQDVNDPVQQLSRAEAADLALLRLVVYAAGATLLLALATSLGV